MAVPDRISQIAFHPERPAAKTWPNLQSPPEDPLSKYIGSSSNAWPFKERPRPPCSLREIIAMVLHYVPNMMATAADIAEIIPQAVPFYAKNNKWVRNVSNNLSDTSYFVKMNRQPGQTAHHYTLTDTYKSDFDVETFKRRNWTHLNHSFFQRRP